MGVSQLFSDYIKPSNGDGSPRAGEFFWIPTPETNFKVMETQRATPEAHTRVEFKLATFDSKRHYRAKDHLPVKLIQMDVNSEALLYRSKLRPCLVLGFAKIGDYGTLHSVNDQRQAKVLSNFTYLVAPLFSANSPTKPSGPFPPQMLARIKVLQYQHLAWVPDFQNQGPGSVLRLDKIFATEITDEMHRCGFKLGPDAYDVIQSQTALALGLELSQRLEDILNSAKELVKESLPPELSVSLAAS